MIAALLSGRTLLTRAIETVETDVALYGRRAHIPQTQQLQYVAMIRLLRYHVTLYYLQTTHVVV